MAISDFTDYLDLEKNYSAHTVNAYKNDIAAFHKFCLEEFDLDDIDKIDYSSIRNWIIVLVGNKISNRSINRKIASLKAYYKFLIKIDSISVNPLAKHKALKTSKTVEVPFSKSEMEEVMEGIEFPDDFEGARDRLIIGLLYSTGIRRIELVNLKLAGISIENATVKVLGKRNKERIIPLSKSILPLIDCYWAQREGINKIVDKEYLFLLKSGNKIYETLVYRIINNYLSKVSSKLKKSPHVLRHTFATHMLNEGADINSVKELLGHSSLASTQVYTHNSIAELKKVHFANHPRSKK